jgi:hypothetical protein
VVMGNLLDRQVAVAVAGTAETVAVGTVLENLPGRLVVVAVLRAWVAVVCGVARLQKGFSVHPTRQVGMALLV